MKTGDMVMQSEQVARWADGKKLAFIGDGDAISVCVALLKHREIFDYGPSEVVESALWVEAAARHQRFRFSEAGVHAETRAQSCLGFTRMLRRARSVDRA
ncbi:hypothetical protein ACW7G0_00005 [Lysobacter sp. A286]